MVSTVRVMEVDEQSTTTSNNKPNSLSHSIRDILGLANSQQESVNDEKDEQKETHETQQQNLKDNNNKSCNLGKLNSFFCFELRVVFWSSRVECCTS